ncbi:transcription factor ILR3-like isoform X2 [Diospyros lotus]|uniref:transcription factor ILR3-like isoform X2 n=1 Tax=Diospyros lotus TaxID=55363 RepID=UPI00225B3D46|nr:transcription factor ILR3-like isoform X2 [Diospyros lotus]
MELDSAQSSIWVFDYGLVEDISAVPGGDFGLPPLGTACFSWQPEALNRCSNLSAEIDSCFADSESPKETGSRKRLRSESCSASGSKACREKLRRDKLNERFLELSSVLDPGRPPKADKGAILSDAVRIVTQLRSEAQKLKESNEDLQEKIKELKAEKNELRDEKQKLKADKEKLEQQVKSVSALPGFLPHPSAIPATFGAEGQAANKLMPFIGYPGVAMWQFIPPAVRDTSQDHVLGHLLLKLENLKVWLYFSTRRLPLSFYSPTALDHLMLVSRSREILICWTIHV